MELLVPTACPITTITVHHPHRPTAVPLFISTATLSFKFKSPHGVISSNSFPKLTATVRTTISARASLIESSTAVETEACAASPSTRWIVGMEKPQTPIPPPERRSSITMSKPLPEFYQVRRKLRCVSTEHLGRRNSSSAATLTRIRPGDLARMPWVMSVRPDRDMETIIMDNSSSNLLLEKQSISNTRASRFSPSVGNCDHWLVKMEKPGVEVVTKAQMVDYFAQTLTKVMGNEKDAQVSIYNISWEKDCGFCCQIDKEGACELSGVPGVLSVQPDENFESENKNYKAYDMSLNTKESHDSPNTSSVPDVKTKRLFVTGLSFYTSEKTLRASFESFGELVEVKIIMDKISKRSKGYAFIEYTTEEAADHKWLDDSC